MPEYLHADVEAVSVESDERGFELHLTLYDDAPVTELILNVHGIAEELYDAVKGAIGPWLQEMESARAEYRAGIRPGGLTDAEREEEIRCAALGMEGPNAKLWRQEQAGQ
jgi:hypothetical protein